MQYRLHIDIPMGHDEENAIETVNSIMKMFEPTHNNSARLNTLGVGEVNYRLGHDEDRQRSNYLVRNENGHISNKKTRISIPV